MSRPFHIFRIPILLVALAALLFGQTPPQSGPTADSRAIGQKRQVHGLPNFGEVSPVLFRGAQPSPDGLKALAKMGVKIVVDARGDRADSEGKIVSQLGMRYVAIPWRCPFPNDDVFVKFLKVLREHPDQKVFVHCRLGDDRTGMMVAAYRMAMEGWTADEALHEMQEFGFSTVHRYVLCPRLASYEQAFPEHLKKNPALQGISPSAPVAQQ